MIYLAQEVKTQKLEVGTAENPQGITLYDEDTKAPYCLKIKNGATISTAGKCGETSTITATSTSP